MKSNLFKITSLLLSVLVVSCGTINQFTVTFDSRGGSGVNSQVVSAESLLAPPTVVKEGHTLDGWYTSLNDGQTLDYKWNFFTDKVNFDFTLYAKWIINQYSITFETNGGNNFSSQTYDYAESLILPTPIKTGHTFASWYTDFGLTQAFTLNTMPASNLTLYAKWTINQYTITFETNGGSSVASITGNYGDTVTVPNDPTRVGYTFNDWYEDSFLTQTSFIPSVMPAYSFTLYAGWSINQYTITFESNGGNSLQTQTYDYAESLSLPTPIKTGHTFGGWYSNQNLYDAFIYDTMPASNLTLYAKWTINQYTITFETNGGTIINPIFGNYGSLVTPPSNPIKEGYTFKGWFINNSTREIVDLVRTFPAYDLTYYASWILPINNTLSLTEVVDAGANHSLALFGNELYSSGYNNFGQLGYETKTTFNINDSQVLIPNLEQNENLLKISAGDDFSIALTDLGRVFSWGKNNLGQLGLGNLSTNSIPQVVNIPIDSNNEEKITHIFAGNTHSLALSNNGNIYGWGSNKARQIYSQGNDIISSPVLLRKGLEIELKQTNERIVRIGAGLNFSLFYTDYGNLYFLGDDAFNDFSFPFEVGFPAQQISFENLLFNEIIARINVGRSHFNILTQLGNVFTIGSKKFGQHGKGISSLYSGNLAMVKIDFSEILNPGESVISISGLENSPIVFTNENRTIAWGDNNNNLLISNNKSIIKPTEINIFNRHINNGFTISGYAIYIKGNNQMYIIVNNLGQLYWYYLS